MLSLRRSYGVFTHSLCLGHVWGFFLVLFCFFYLYCICSAWTEIPSFHVSALHLKSFHVFTETTGEKMGGLPRVRQLPSPPPPTRTKPPQLRAWPSNLPSSLGVHRARSQGFTSAQGQRLCAGQSHFCRRNRLLPGLELLLLELGRLAGEYVAAQQAELATAWLVPSSGTDSWHEHITFDWQTGKL